MGLDIHRAEMFDFIQKLPSTNDTLSNWITELQQKGINLTVDFGKANVRIESLFRIVNHQFRQERPLPENNSFGKRHDIGGYFSISI